MMMNNVGIDVSVVDFDVDNSVFDVVAVLDFLVIWVWKSITAKTQWTTTKIVELGN